MKTAEMEIRLLREEDLRYLPELYRTVFEVDKDERFWRWKYFMNPAGEHMMAVAFDPAEKKVIGQIGTIPVYMAFNGKKVMGAQTCDIVILPEHQKGGPFFKLYELSTNANVERGVKLMFGYSITRTLKISVRMLKFKSVFPIKRLVRVLNPASFIERKIGLKPLASALGGISAVALKAVYPAPVRIPSGFRIEEVSSFDKRYDRLMEKVAEKVRIMVYKDSEYLNWRYMKCPSSNYRVFAVVNDSEVAGFTVVGIEDEEIRRAYILELLMDPSKEELAETLLNRAVSYCYEAKADIVNSWSVEGSAQWRVKLKNGFSVKETAHNLIVRDYTGEDTGTDMTDAGLWDISMGDSDYH